MSLRYCQFCPVAKAAEILGERWTILILRELLLGMTRYSELQRGLSRISPTLLTRRLQQLQDQGLIQRKAGGRGGHEYRLTPAGRELLPVVMNLGKWGMRWARGQMVDDELDVQLLMLDYTRRIDADALPDGRTVVQFSFPGLPKFAHWWIVIDAGDKRDLCVTNPGRTVDLHIKADLRTMVAVWAGDVTMRAARADGRVEVSGDPVLARTLTTWLRGGIFAGVRPAAGAKR